MKKNNIFNIVSKCIVLIISIFVLTFNNSLNTCKVTGLLLLIINIISICRVRNNWLLIIILGFMFYSNFSIVMADYFHVVNDFFTSFSNEEVSIIGLNILFLFNSLIFIMLPTKVNSNILELKESIEKTEQGNIVVNAIILALIVILFFFFSRPTVPGQRGSSSTIYEYAIILFIIGYLFSNKRQKRILNFIIFFYILQDLVFGNRVTALQMIILEFLVVFSDKFSIKQLLPLLVISIVLFTGIGQYRGEFSLSIETFIQIFNSLFSNGFVNDTAYSAFFTSLTFLKLSNILSFGKRITYFVPFFLSIFLGGSVPNSSLPIITREYYLHYYGGIYPYFFYFYFGIFGILISSLMLCIFIKKINQISFTSSIYCKAIAIYATCTVPRWYLYSPLILFRGSIFILIIIFVLKQFTKYKIK